MYRCLIKLKNASTLSNQLLRPFCFDFYLKVLGLKYSNTTSVRKITTLQYKRLNYISVSRGSKVDVGSYKTKLRSKNLYQSKKK